MPRKPNRHREEIKNGATEFEDETTQSQTFFERAASIGVALAHLGRRLFSWIRSWFGKNNKVADLSTERHDRPTPEAAALKDRNSTEARDSTDLHVKQIEEEITPDKQLGVQGTFRHSTRRQSAATLESQILDPESAQTLTGAEQVEDTPPGLSESEIMEKLEASVPYKEEKEASTNADQIVKGLQGLNEREVTEKLTDLVIQGKITDDLIEEFAKHAADGNGQYENVLQNILQIKLTHDNPNLLDPESKLEPDVIDITIPQERDKLFHELEASPHLRKFVFNDKIDDATKRKIKAIIERNNRFFTDIKKVLCADLTQAVAAGGKAPKGHFELLVDRYLANQHVFMAMFNNFIENINGKTQARAINNLAMLQKPDDTWLKERLAKKPEALQEIYSLLRKYYLERQKSVANPQRAIDKELSGLHLQAELSALGRTSYEPAKPSADLSAFDEAAAKRFSTRP
jgi:hypothetical protein